MSNRFFTNSFNAPFGSQAKSAVMNGMFASIEHACDLIQAEMDAMPGLHGITTIPGFPSSFTGAAAKALRVNAAETAVEFVTYGQLAIKTITGTSYTIVAADAGTLLIFTNASAVTVTVPKDVLAQGDVIQIRQGGAGTVTLAAASGVTLTSADGLFSTRAQYAQISLLSDGSNQFCVVDPLTVAGKVASTRFEAAHTSDTGTPDAAFRATGTLASLVLNGGHAFRDDTTVSSAVAGSGYNSFDVAPTINATGMDHSVGFQSRPTINGGMTNLYGATDAPNIASGSAVVNRYGWYVFNPTGTGAPQNNYGFFVANQTKGSVSNYAGYIANQSGPLYCGAPIQVNNKFMVNPSVPFIIAGPTTLGYPYYGYNYDPVTDDKAVNDVAITTKLDSSGMRVYVKATGAPLGGSGMLASMTEGFRVDLTGAAYFPAVGTTASAANAYIDNASSNKLLRSTSSIRYKTDVIDVPADAVDRLMTLRPVRYRSLAPADNGAWSYYGLIAEEVAQVDPRLVHWSYDEADFETVEHRTETPILVDTGLLDEDGKPIMREGSEVKTEQVRQLKAGATLRPDGVQYERIAVLMLERLRRIEAHINPVQ